MRLLHGFLQILLLLRQVASCISFLHSPKSSFVCNSRLIHSIKSGRTSFNLFLGEYPKTLRARLMLVSKSYAFPVLDFVCRGLSGFSEKEQIKVANSFIVITSSPAMLNAD